LLVTHDPLEALRLGDYVYVLSGSPVSLSEPITPQGSVPRDPGDTKILALQAKLLKLLAGE
jgi:putative hydroxymethylpyrimidine transport system ATP-binding protein